MIDEVHGLREDRGATLEAVISRFKMLQDGVSRRFVGVSATAPNLEGT
jgi:ATP-dependent DNA helicase HFM1/MER3